MGALSEELALFLQPVRPKRRRGGSTGRIGFVPSAGPPQAPPRGLYRKNWLCSFSRSASGAVAGAPPVELALFLRRRRRRPAGKIGFVPSAAWPQAPSPGLYRKNWLCSFSRSASGAAAGALPEKLALFRLKRRGLPTRKIGFVPSAAPPQAPLFPAPAPSKSSPRRRRCRPRGRRSHPGAPPIVWYRLEAPGRAARSGRGGRAGQDARAGFRIRSSGRPAPTKFTEPSRFTRSTSIAIRSPSRSFPMGPPASASGETWPMQAPVEDAAESGVRQQRHVFAEGEVLQRRRELVGFLHAGAHGTAAGQHQHVARRMRSLLM